MPRIWNIRRRGLEIATTAQVETAGIPIDQVLAQSPPANATQVLAPKISLLITSPAEPQAFVMPSFIGQPLGTVSRTLLDSGFRLGNVAVSIPNTPVAENLPGTNGSPYRFRAERPEPAVLRRFFQTSFLSRPGRAPSLYGRGKPARGSPGMLRQPSFCVCRPSV